VSKPEEEKETKSSCRSWIKDKDKYWFDDDDDDDVYVQTLRSLLNMHFSYR